ncbi:hypothetical protein ABTM51_20765, partial [Acinetobacter baumannii]
EDDEDYADGEFDDGGYDDGQGVTEVDTSDKDHVATIEGGVIENGFDGEDEGAGDTTGSDAEDGDDAARESGEDDNRRPRRGRRQG